MIKNKSFTILIMLSTITVIMQEYIYITGKQEHMIEKSS